MERLRIEDAVRRGMIAAGIKAAMRYENTPHLNTAKADPLADRRARAREAFWDESQGTMTGASAGIEEAIETATRVKITEDIVEAAQQAGPFWNSVDEARPVLIAAFRAAGFEVED